MPGGAYINGRYVAGGGKGKGKGKGGGGGELRGWTSEKKEGDDRGEFERKPGDEEVTLERRFDIDVLQPGESRVGYLFNMKPTRHYDEGGRTLSGLLLYFLQRDGSTFRCTFLYRPYFFVQVGNREQLHPLRDILAQRFENDGSHVEIVEKEDLDLEDHIVGRKRKLIKMSFTHVEALNQAYRSLFRDMKRKNNDGDNFSFDNTQKGGSATDFIQELYEYDVPYVNRVCIDNSINCGKWFTVTRNQMATSADNIWDTQSIISPPPKALETARPGLRIFAWDIECMKEPLKFPDSSKDHISLISVMVDATGFLIVNREEVSEDIEPLEYTPKPEYEGIFQTYNEPDEASLLRRFFTLIRETSPHVMVSFNGDFFDYPFVTNRAKAYNLDWAVESGIEKSPDGDFYVGKWIVHLDCFAWVQRDSYLPCGARGLKAVTRYKLKYDPVELDPEDMTPFCKERPQEMAAYSVSDAVATYYLYMKYIHDFIFALCSIIPYGPDDVLRKGSGTLCESLLMTQATKANVLYPNKHVDVAIDFHEATSRMIEQSTYEGARVECMRVGIYREDIQETFQLEPSAFRTLLEDLKGTIDFFLTAEEKVKIEDVENYDEVYADVEATLRKLCDPEKVAAQVGRMAMDSPNKSQVNAEDQYNLKLVEYEVVEGKAGVKQGGKKVKKSSYRVIKDDYPFIYHLDVGAMYPNIILSNRLQPSAIVSKEFCNACTYNDPSNKCKRPMDWKWRGELYMATRADVKSIMNEMENEKRRYNHKDREGQMERVPWRELSEKEKTAEITKAVREFSQKAYRRVKSSIYEDKTDVVCQRENSFYVDTVRMFRDRRYEFKRAVKTSNKELEKAEEAGDAVAKMAAKDKVLLYDSLQLAHKCILNSFYGYVMRKGARWHSMKMAGIVTYTGSNLIREAREFCEQVGLPIELDTDGIWCLLPKSFPDVFKFKMKGGKEIKMPYPNCVLNFRVHQKYTNHQYQNRNDKGEWVTQSENSIFFEIDGPYRAMVLPASTEEDKMLKKRYCVFEHDGSIAELKGFEVKRRGELKLIQVFQTEVFPEFLKGKSKQEVYNIVGTMANRWLDVIESKGKTMTDDEVIHFFSESKSMSKSVEANGAYKSVQCTTVKRLAEFLGVDTLLKDDGISAHLLIANKPVNVSVTERAIPVKIFSAEYEVKKQWLQRWCQDTSMNNFDMRAIIDWDYYKERLCAVFQKLISIPAAYQQIANPCPRVKVPEWLRKRVAEKNDKFQQRSLGLWLRKSDGPKAGVDAAEGELAAKRKMCDLEDLGEAFGPDATKRGGRGELPAPVPFGTGPKRWLEAQRLRWAATPQNAGTGAGSGGRPSIFSDHAAWATVSKEALAATWHIVAVEPSAVLRGSRSALRVGDAVLVELQGDDDEELPGEDAELVQQKGRIVGSVGGLWRVNLEDGRERLLRQSAVKPLKEEGLYTLWVATGQSLTVHRCEVLMPRRVILALESEFSPEGQRCGVQPSKLTKGLRVWPREPSEKRVGPGTVTSAASEIGLCSVTWANDVVDIVLASELERQCGSATKVLRDPPRNMQHACLIELELAEDEFQRHRGEGAMPEHDGTWPRIDSVYEAEQPLDFDLISRVGATAKLAGLEKAEGAKGNRELRFTPEDLEAVPKTDYLKGLTPERNVYVHLCFDRARPSRAFCAIFAPTLAEVWACFGGIGPAEGEDMRPGLEQALAEQLSQADQLVRAEVSFLSGGKSLNLIVPWIEHRLQEIRRRDGGMICVLCSQLSTNELRGVTPCHWIDQRHLRHLAVFREMPVCRTPFVASDGNFPALDWPKWICKRFAGRIPRIFDWWRARHALCSAASLPICNVPERVPIMVPTALDVMYARQLRQDSQLRWTSCSSRPDLGETSVALVDAQEATVDSVNWILQTAAAARSNAAAVADPAAQERDLSSTRGGGKVNCPGTYRSVCMEVNLRSKLCICAIQHARALSDMEGGELSRKMIRKVAGAGGEVYAKQLDHTSEVSVSSLESLVNMVQAIVAVEEEKEAEISKLRQTMAAQCELKGDFDADDDEAFLEAVTKAGHADDIKTARLELLRAEDDAQKKLLDGLYGWLASPASMLYDAALLRKVHQYMDKALQLFVKELRKNGCNVIHASYTKVLFATGKLRVLPDAENFWASLIDNVSSSYGGILKPLELWDPQCLAETYYGMLWLDPANFAALPIDRATSQVIWKVSSCWNLAGFLPKAVRGSVILYASDLLLAPQRELGRRYGTSAACAVPPNAEEEADPAAAMEVDCDAGDECAAMEEDAESGCEGEQRTTSAAAAPPAEEGSAAGAAAAAAASLAAGGGEAGGDGEAKHAEILEEIRGYTQGEFWDNLRQRVLNYVEELQVQYQRETHEAEEAARAAAAGGRAEEEEESEDEENPEGHGNGTRARPLTGERLKRHVEDKWAFPDMPGRREPPGSVSVEFMRALIQIFQVEEWLTDEVPALRDRICQKIRVSSFGASMQFETPCFPLILRDVTCPWCFKASNVDVTSHPFDAPGLWACPSCDKLYDKDAMQAELVGLFESVVQAWHSQEITCSKCKKLQTSKIQHVCECFGRFENRFKAEDFNLVLRVLRSVAIKHDLPWLSGMLDMHEQISG